MTCQEVAFARATCRIEIHEQSHSAGLPSFVARMWLVDDSGAIDPFVFDGGQTAEIHARTEELALSSAVTYLSSRFGGLSEYPHRCQSPSESEHTGPPILIDPAP